MSTSVSPSPNPTPPGSTGAGGGAAGSSHANQVASKARRERRLKRIVTVVAGLMLIGVLFLVIRVQGHVSGEEFAPTHFQKRSFSFFEIPLLHIQITPIRRRASTPGTANYLRLNSLVQTATGVPGTWHLVSLSRGITGKTPADADLLVTQLALEQGGNEYWRTWSVDHPKLAKVFWPRIQDLAKRELYILMPPLFELAQDASDAQQLKSDIEKRLRIDIASLVEDLRSADRRDLADQILTEARVDFPEDAKLKQLDEQAEPSPVD